MVTWIIHVSDTVSAEPRTDDQTAAGESKLVVKWLLGLYLFHPYELSASYANKY